MTDVFVVEDSFGKSVRLTKERWAYINARHPDVSLEDLREGLRNPSSVRKSDNDPESVKWFYRFDKKKALYLLVSVKYLNGEGFVITAYHTKKVKGRR